MINLTDRAGSALSKSLTEEDRVTGKVFRFKLLEDTTVELTKEVPDEGDEQLEHEGYPVLAVPSDVSTAFDSLNVDVAPSPDGKSMNLVIKSGTGA